jgi:hypothetical protein
MGHGTPKGRGTHLGSKMCAKENKNKSRMHENDQAAILWTPRKVTAPVLRKRNESNARKRSGSDIVDTSKGHGIHPGLRMRKKNKSNARKRSGDNENAILWTPLLTPFAQMDILGP